MYKKTIIGLVVVCVLLVMGILALSIGWGLTGKKASAENKGLSLELENVYKRNYYELTYELSNASDSLNKLLVTHSPSLQQKLLGDFSDQTSAAVVCLTTLTDTSASGENTISFINKISDYAKSLNYKLALGKALSNDDKDNLAAIYTALTSLNANLQKISDKVEDNYEFIKALNTDNDLMVGFLSGVEMDIKYPSLIYDGPFSDALEEKTPKMGGDKIDKDTALLRAKSYLPFTAEPIYQGESEGSIPTYIFGVSAKGKDYTIQVAKNGGWLVTLTTNITANDNQYSEQEAVTVAQNYLAQLGITDMEAVWVSDYNSIYFINFVFKQSGTLIYPDMIKIKVSAEDNGIVGVECLNYLYNHTQRTIDEPIVSQEDAKNDVEDIQIQSTKPVIIPVDGGKELLCWEIAGKSNDDYYFIYVDCQSGEQIKIMRVVDSAQGKLLL